jgi:hypothetical protein
VFEKAKAFMSGRSQAVRIPAEFRFWQATASLEEIFAALDAVGVPEDFLSPVECVQGRPQLRTEFMWTTCTTA